jgi:hypothetical protein
VRGTRWPARRNFVGISKGQQMATTPSSLEEEFFAIEGRPAVVRAPVDYGSVIAELEYELSMLPAIQSDLSVAMAAAAMRFTIELLRERETAQRKGPQRVDGVLG